MKTISDIVGSKPYKIHNQFISRHDATVGISVYAYEFL